MSKNVFANGKEISAKKDGNQSICAMPDVCLSPPSPPAGPVPVPYPNTAKASDTSGGSKSVKIGGGEIGLKNASDYKKSMGDEAATKSLGMGVVTHTIQGKMKFAAWSFDVKIEGKNVIRHMDLTTHNHMNTNNSGSMQVSQAKETSGEIEEPDCKKLASENNQARTQEVDVPEDGGIAVSTAFVKPPGKIWKASSQSVRVREEFRDGYRLEGAEGEIPECAGLKKDGENKKWSRRGNDSEAKLLNPEMKGGARAQSITIKVWHRGNNGEVDSLPCWSCKEAICGAEKCGIMVTLCNKDDEPVRADPELCKDGTPKPEGASPKSKERDEFWRKKGF